MIVDVDFTQVILALLIMYPIIPLVRNYIWLRSTDYLYFAGIFLFLSLDILLGALDLGSEKYNQINLIFQVTFFIISYTCMLIISSRTLGEDGTLLFGNYFWKILTIFTLTQSIVVRSLGSDLVIELDTLITVIFEIYRVYVGYIIYHTFKTIDYVHKTERTEKISYYWSLNGIVIISFGIQRISFGIARLLFTLNELTHQLDLLGVVDSILFIIIVAIGGLISLNIAIRYPEAMLISKAQFVQARKLYQFFNHPEKVKKTSSTQAILDYLNSIPEDIRELSRDFKS